VRFDYSVLLLAADGLTGVTGLRLNQPEEPWRHRDMDRAAGCGFHMGNQSVINVVHILTKVIFAQTFTYIKSHWTVVKSC